MSAFVPKTRVHIVGVGGAGMSGVARLLLEMGCVVSGSDAQQSDVLHDLAVAGISVTVGADATHGQDAEIIVWSPAVDLEHVELVAGRQRHARMLTRAEALAELSTLQPVLGITGTHGKTTATSMLVHVLHAAHRDDSRLLGAPVLGVGPNGHWGNGALVLEVDESYGTFALLSPHALGVLNVEPDHLDHYGTLDNLELAFVSLIERTTGVVVLWVDDAGVARIRARLERDVVTVSEQDDASWNVRDIEVSQRGSSFVLANRDEQHELTLHVTGRHNVLNAAVVAVLALESGIAIEAVRSGLALFEGVPRRFDLRGSWRGVDVYEDYAHLPSEIAVTLAAARSAGYQRITAVFQPHRVTRTLALASDFARAFQLADSVVITDIYSAGEPNPTAITGMVVAEAVRTVQPSESVFYEPTFDDVATSLDLLLEQSDVIFLLGAGDVAGIIDHLPGGLDK